MINTVLTGISLIWMYLISHIYIIQDYVSGLDTQPFLAYHPPHELHYHRDPAGARL